MNTTPLDDDGLDHASNSHDAICHAVDHAAHLLPSQGPITVFVHHNTLHAFEEMEFDEGVKAGGRLFGSHAFLPEERYRQKLTRGRIRVADLEAVLLDDLGEDADRLVAHFGTRFALRLAMLRIPLQSADSAQLRWMIAETDALRRFREEVAPNVRERMIDETRRWVMRNLQTGKAKKAPAIDVLDDVWEQFDRRAMDSWDDRTWEAFVLNFLWRVCRHGVRQGQNSESHDELARPVNRHRQLLLDATGEDADLRVNELLVKLCAAFVEQGFAEWELPNRSLGLYQSFLSLFAIPFASPTEWLAELRREAKRLIELHMTPLESIEESLMLLGVGENETEEFITQTLMALRGWAGIIWQLETNAEWAPFPAPAGSLTEFLAVRLVLDRLAAAAIGKEFLGFDGPLANLRTVAARRIPTLPRNGVEHRAFTVFQLAQVRGWNPEDLQNLSGEQWAVLVNEIEAFSGLERRRVFHLAFERKYRNDVFDAIIAHATQSERSVTRPTRPSAPAFQVVACVDDREESFRRHLEECDPDCETFGVAGFFGIAMFYRGVADAHFKPLCPVTVKPEHFVIEEPLYSMQAESNFRALARRRLGYVTHQAHRGSRSFLGGIVTTLVGSLAAFPLVARIFFPRLTAEIRQWIGRVVQPPTTQLRLERLEDEPGRQNGQLGFSDVEMANIVEGVLRAIGLTQGWSRLIAFLGHGASSLNNPHESAYNCGACSGSRGGPNGRAFAQMANDRRVRSRLAERGLLIPDESYFVGGYHDTTNDAVSFADLDRLPLSHREDFKRLWSAIGEARARNAHERCRRFHSARVDLTALEALRHVEGRAEDLSQARPEYNHATNALCLVGRRKWSRGLFLDRRAFLSSYDPAQDDQRGSILEGILRPAIPLCAGINLEYYFSTVDTEGYGCGSKLPHNVTSLVGVMSGAASDLRPGLSAQMTEIHEPMRILFVVETTAEIIRRIITANPGIARLVEGNWVQFAVFDPDTATVQRYVGGEFVPYKPESTDLSTVAQSLDWYRGLRDHLGVAEIVTSHEVAS